jgi:hypothetical protein
MNLTGPLMSPSSVPGAAGSRRPGLASPSGWGAAVLVSAVVLALAGVALGLDWLITSRSRTKTVSLSYLPTSLELSLSSGSVEIVGGSSGAVFVQRTDRYAFGHTAHESRTLVGGVLRLVSACPRIIVGSCSASYRVTVPDNVAVKVRTTSGDVHISGFRGMAAIRTDSGGIAVDAYCGFGLSAVSRSGSVGVVAACAPENLDLLSDSGNARAVVPVGRYRILAGSSSGRQRISGVVAGSHAPFTISVHSRSGDVSVEGGL